MTDNDRWTSDQLLQAGGMGVYADQVRFVFRDHKEGFRGLAVETYEDLKNSPIQGDNALQAWWHARKVARVLRAMERRTQQVVSLAKRLENTHDRIYVQLPKERAQKAIEKELRKSQQAALAAQSGDRLNRATQQVLGAASDPAESAGQEREESRVFDFDLFSQRKTG
ncbi:hypothetical protein [Streptomyces sp. NPDC001530]|uniref:hypothetical protein n=1 Tax=Streptomyces sp. NPDC001530 TaxID=3364582 RepID=UPI003697575F